MENSEDEENFLTFEELFFVRSNEGFKGDELLSLLYAACDSLLSQPSNHRIFTPETILIERNGKIKIDRIPVNDENVEKLFPDLTILSDGELSALNSALSARGDTRDVWNLGQIFLKIKPETMEADVLSLLNLMTLDVSEHRPSLLKIRQIIKSKPVFSLERVAVTLSTLYEEIMGSYFDFAENDPFPNDDIKLDSSRSSVILIPGDLTGKDSSNKSPSLHSLNETSFSSDNTNTQQIEHKNSLKRSSSLVLNDQTNKKPAQAYGGKLDSPVQNANNQNSTVITITDNNAPGSSIITCENTNITKATNEHQNRAFVRQNSLRPDQIRNSIYSKNRHNDSLSVKPEFVSNKSQPLIRLRAQSFRKKGITFLRSDNSIVYVELLNGCNLEVICKTDALVSHIFQSVVDHQNITEHIFFGLAIHSENEYIFLEDNQKLEKYATYGWRRMGESSSPQANNKVPKFCLKLRFRYYPKRREFIKTDTTAHQLYLQLRQDMLDGALRFPSEKALEMAALALCVESGGSSGPASGSLLSYTLDEYLPTRIYPELTRERLQVQFSQILRQLSHFSSGDSSAEEGGRRREAEERFIRLAQAERLFGAYLYRVEKFKPSKRVTQPAWNKPDVEYALAILPFGIAVCRRDAARKGSSAFQTVPAVKEFSQQMATFQVTAMHEWHAINTLQFDRKRLIISTLENGVPEDHIFYAEHSSKSRYLTQFAATQHRFMMKMRQWQSALNHQTYEGTPDVTIETDEQRERAVMGNLANSSNTFDRAEGHENGAHENDDSGAVRLTLTLEKDPVHGLGLTLVDGHVNGVRGVYVKSVSPDGNAKRRGLQIGDRLVAINGQTLENRTRHDAVEIVRRAPAQLSVEIFRLPLLCDASGEIISAGNGAGIGGIPPVFEEKGPDSGVINGENSSKNVLVSVEINNNDKTPQNSAPKNLQNIGNEPPKMAVETVPLKMKSSKTTLMPKSPPTPAAKSGASKAQTPSNPAPKYQRAVSDFGAIGDTLPFLRTDDFLSSLQKQRYHRGTGLKEFRDQTTTVVEEESTESEVENDDKDGGSSGDEEMSRSQRKSYGEFRPSTTLYAFANEDDEEDGMGVSDAEDNKESGNYFGNNNKKEAATTSATRGSGSKLARKQIRATEQQQFLYQKSANVGASAYKKNIAGTRGGSNNTSLDWANDLADIEEQHEEQSAVPQQLQNPEGKFHHRFQQR